MSSVAEPPAQPAVQKVFVCYRREETGAHAGRIYDAMVSRFGEENVFMDLELAPGVDFVEHITEVVSGCLALIIVMGPHWATVEDGTGRRRLDDPEDFVRLEVGNALRRDDVTPIPVLVGGAQMPQPEELPAELRPLTRRNALEMSDMRWSYDVGRLLSRLEELLPAGAEVERPDREPVPPSPVPALHPWRLALEGAFVAGTAAALARGLAELVIKFKEAGNGENWEETAGHIASELGRRTGVAALAGIAVALWLALRVRETDPINPAFRGLAIGALAGFLGGLLWTVPVYYPDEKMGFEARSLIELGAIAVTGGIFGSLIGTLWRPRRKGAAIGGGAIGGVIFASLVLALEWKTGTVGARMLVAGLASASIAGLALVVLLVLDRGEAREGRIFAGARTPS